MGLFGVLGIARDGLSAQSAALTNAGQNVANVNTPGYVKRTTVLETSSTGGGVRVASVQRNFDRFAFAHTVTEQGKFGAATTRSNALTEMETIMAPSSNSIGDQATRFVQSWSALAASPTDPSQRADVLAKAENLSNTIATTAERLESQGEQLLGRAQVTVKELNGKLDRIAKLNEQIATAVGSGGDSGALRDQRDVLLRDVGDRIGGKAVEDATGKVTVFAAGAVLVEGTNAAPLSMDLDNDGAMRFYVHGAAKTEVTSRIDTGSLGGLREARDVDLAKTKSNLDSYAHDVANAFNAVHSTGYGTDGGTGRNLFAAPTGVAGAAKAMRVDPAVHGQPSRVAAADAAGSLPGGNKIAQAMSDLADKTAFGGSTLVDRFVGLATDVGFRKAAADSELQLRTDTLGAAESMSESANGISLDEEMVDITRYQRAFEASTKVLRTVDELLQGLMESF